MQRTGQIRALNHAGPGSDLQIHGSDTGSLPKNRFGNGVQNWDK